MSKKHTTESFIADARAVHGDAYDYSDFQYPGSNKTKTKFVCREHGPWVQRPNDHLSGYGCPKCGAARKSTITWREFLLKARGIHGDLYEYEERRIRYFMDRVRVRCRIHGWFSQKVSHHVQRGQGCRKCCFRKRDTSNYVPWTRSAWIEMSGAATGRLYVLECKGNGEVFLKVGITCHPIENRFRGTSKRIRYDWRVVHEIQGSAAAVYDMEKSMHASLKEFRYRPVRSFVGHTECFSMDAMHVIGRLMGRAQA